MNKIRLAILASGSGSNAQAIIEYFSGHDSIEVACILSDKLEAGVHARTALFDLPSFTLSDEERTRPGLFLDRLHETRVDFLVLAGYLRRIPVELVNEYPRRIVNIHPSLLPKFGGKGMYGDRIHAAVIETGQKETGITIHWINEQYDEGEVIFQATCPVLPGDTVGRLAERIHQLEHAHYPRVIEAVVKECFHVH